MRQRVRIGVVGVGHLGEYHVQKYGAMEDVELVGVLDTNTDRAGEIAQRYNTRAYESLEEMLKQVDGVSIAVPTEHHFTVASRILPQNVHVLIEKPITYDEDDASHLISMARERNLVLQVGHVERFNPAVVKMESLLNRPLFIESHRMNLFTVRGTDVDVVLDLMIHDLDIILHMAQSKVGEVHAVGMSVITRKTDIANARIIFQNGTVANLTASRVSNQPLRKIRIFQPDAYISVNCYKKEVSVTRLDDSLNTEPFPHIVSNNMKYPDADPLNDQLHAFVHAIQTGAEPVVTGEDGRTALRVALAIIKQIAGGTKNFQGID